MKSKAKKIAGFLLLGLGVGIIGVTLLASYNIFTDKTQVPALFTADDFEQKEEAVIEEEEGTFEEQIRKTVVQETRNQLEKMMPPSLVARLLNLVSWSIFAGIAIFGGTQFSKLGITLLK